jgi:hypothetical protein
MTGGRSQRQAALLLEHETTAKLKFPLWDANARAHYDTLKEKDRQGNLKDRSLDHYLFHIHLHNLRENKIKQVKSDAAQSKTTKNSGTASAQPPKAAPAEKGKGEGGKGESDGEFSDDPSTSTLEKAPHTAVHIRAARDNANNEDNADDAADSSKRKNKPTNGDGKRGSSDQSSDESKYLSSLHNVLNLF